MVQEVPRARGKTHVKTMKLMNRRERATYALRQAASLLWIARRYSKECNGRTSSGMSNLEMAWWALSAASQCMDTRRAMERELT
jgi:hypothetical protein